MFGIAVFLHAADIPKHPSWVHAGGSPIRCVAFDTVLRAFIEREPDNPFVAVFAPLIMIIDSDAELAARAPALWQRIQHAPLAEDIRETLSNVLEFWFFERYKGKTEEEIWAMLNLVTPIEEKKAYQSIFAKGEAKGLTKGKAATLHHLLTRRFGPLQPWAAQRIAVATEAQLERWLDGIFDATSVENLLGAEERH